MLKRFSLALFKNIKTLIEASRSEIVQTINTRIVETYFHVGRLIVEFEQQGKTRAQYASNTLQELSNGLAKEFGKGFSVDNLENMRKFYLSFRKSETVSRKSSFIPLFKLSWSHYILLLRIENEDERKFL